MKIALPLILAASITSAGADCLVHVEAVSDDGHPLPSMAVWAEAGGTGLRTGQRMTDAQGVATIEGIPDGAAFRVFGAFGGNIVNPVGGECTSQGASVRLVAIVPQQVSLIAVIATPQAFDGRYIVVKGVLDVQFEADALYLDEASLRNAVRKNAIRVEVPDDRRKTLKQGSGRYTFVVGRFNARNLGRNSAFSGSLEDIQWH